MRAVRPLLPYALASAAIVVASLVALGVTVRAPAPGAVAPAASTSPSGTAAATLSDRGRLAYWRTGASGTQELWVSDLDGGRRWRAAVESANEKISLTQWSPDGSAVAFTPGGTGVVVLRLNGTAARIGMPVSLVAESWRIVSFEISPDASRIAATFRAANGFSNESDVYLADARAGALWRRLTTLGNAYAGRWIDADRLFIETAYGLVAVEDLSADSLRPLATGSVTSPRIGRDGRVYVARGGVQPQVFGPPGATGWIQSMTIDGDDLRDETPRGGTPEYYPGTPPLLGMRLVGMLADGRAAVTASGFGYLLGEQKVTLALGSGIVRKVAVASDGKRVVGMTDSRVLLIDAAKVRSNDPPSDAATMLLADVRDPDVWFPPPSVAPVHAARPGPQAPAARLAFTTGTALWRTDADGTTRLLLAEGPAWMSDPVWSPAGDRVAILVGGGDEREVAVIRATGTVRWKLPPSPWGYVGLFWSADGATLAVWTADARPGGSGPVAVRWWTDVYDATSGTRVERLEGRVRPETWGRILLGDGVALTGEGVRGWQVGQTIDLITAQGRRRVADAEALAADPLVRPLVGAEGRGSIQWVSASADGRYLAVQLFRVTPEQAKGAYVVLDAADGRPRWAVPTAGFGIDWSPVGSRFARTWSDPAQLRGGPVRAIVQDAETEEVVIDPPGSFAGWSPEGDWIYVTREDGLYAVRLDGSVETRVGPLAVSVAAARP